MNTKQVESLYDDGVSLRKIAKQVGETYHKVRYHLVKSGKHTVRSEYLNEHGEVECLGCEQYKPMKFYPNYEKAGDRHCVDCGRERLLKHDLKKRGNCSIEQYEALLTEQDGKCFICDKDYGHFSKNGKKARLAVDHCHKTGKVRGLLCNQCNRGLGFLESNLEKAIEYLKKHPTE